MMDIPEDILTAIEADVQRYRTVRINAAKKRLTPEFKAKLVRRAERKWFRSSEGKLEVVSRFARGESPSQIAFDFSYISDAMIKDTINSWLYNKINENRHPNLWDDSDIGRYYEPRWRRLAKQFSNMAPE